MARIEELLREKPDIRPDPQAPALRPFSVELSIGASLTLGSLVLRGCERGGRQPIIRERYPAYISGLVLVVPRLRRPSV